MAKLKTIVSMEAGEARCSVDTSSTRSGSFETTNNFKLIVFDRNTLALIFFLALFLLSITLVRSFNFVFHLKLMKIFFRLVSYYSILSALRWRHFTQKVGESLCLTHFLVSSTAKPKEVWLKGEKCVKSCLVVATLKHCSKYIGSIKADWPTKGCDKKDDLGFTKSSFLSQPL